MNTKIENLIKVKQYIIESHERQLKKIDDKIIALREAEEINNEDLMVASDKYDEVSNCCYAPVDKMTCRDCKEPCDIELIEK